MYKNVKKQLHERIDKEKKEKYNKAIINSGNKQRTS